MSIVNASLPGSTVLDLFAGSGALGLEALSRGALRVDFVENAAASLATIRANADSLGAGASARIHRADAVQFLDGLGALAYDVAFADPPYDRGLAATIAERWLANPFAQLLAIEHRSNEQLPEPGDRRRYGGTALTFYRAVAPGD